MFWVFLVFWAPSFKPNPSVTTTGGTFGFPPPQRGVTEMESFTNFRNKTKTKIPNNVKRNILKLNLGYLGENFDENFGENFILYTFNLHNNFGCLL